jgi:hypothetical protein
MKTPSEEFVVEAFEKNFDLPLTKIPESDMKSPDFEKSGALGRAFVIELKDIEAVEASEATGWVVRYHSSGIREAERMNNSVSRIATKVYDAFKQLEKFVEPKGIVFLNFDSRVGIQHFDEAYRGYRVYSHGEFAYKNIASKRVIEGRLKDVKDKIDFFIWFEHDSGRWFSVLRLNVARRY